MLVGAFACAHTPQLLIRPPTEDRDLVLRVHAAFARVRERLTALRPDVIAIVAGHHIEAFFLDAVPALAVYVGAECAGEFGPYRHRYPIHEPRARGAHRGHRAWVRSPLHAGSPARLRLPRAAPLHDAGAGRAHRAAPRERVSAAPADAAALLRLGRGPGGHPAGAGRARGAHGFRGHVAFSGHRYASPDVEWARQVLDRLAAGQGRDLAALTAPELDKTGNVDLRTWITLLGAVGDARAQVYCYEPSWHHGNAVVEWAGMSDALHYPFPPAGAYGLNR